MVYSGVRASVTFFTKKCVFLMKASLLHEVERPHVLDLAVHQVNYFGQMGGGGPCDFSVSPSPLGFTFDFGLGLDNKEAVFCLLAIDQLLVVSDTRTLFENRSDENFFDCPA